MRSSLGNDFATLKGKQIMSLKKQYLKSKPLCKVTFRLNAEAAQDAKEAALIAFLADAMIMGKTFRVNDREVYLGKLSLAI